MLGLIQASQDAARANSFGIFQADSNGFGTNSGPASDAASGGTSSIAIGINAITGQPTGSGDSISIGTDTSATNQDSIAIGAQTTASGINTIAIGNNGTTASGEDADVFGVGSIASGTASSVFGSSAFVNSGYGSAFGAGSSVTAIGGSAIGALSSVTSQYGTALGYGSVANRAGLNGNEAFSNTAVSSPYGALSIGQPGDERQITNLAGGTQDTDAVNVRQLRAVGENAAAAFGGGSAYNSSTNAYTAPTYTVGGQTYHNVADAMTESNNLAVQYTPDNTGAATNVVDLSKNGQLNPVSVTGLAPATTGSGAVSLSQLPLQYSTAGAPTTANPAIASNDVTLIGTGGNAVTLHNVAPGALTSASTDAVDGQQLYSTNQQVASLEAGTTGLVQQDPSSRKITVGAATDGTDVTFVNAAGTSRTLSNVAAGQIASGSTQAINGGQAYNTATSVANNLGGSSVVNPDGTISAPSYNVQGATYDNVGGAIGGLNTAITDINSTGTRYVAVNSTGNPASATGMDAAAVGPNTTSTAAGGVALGANAVASRAGLNGAREMFSDISVASTAGAVSVGAAGAERQITNVAGGTAPTDAVNVRQLTAVGQQVATVFGGGASLNPDGTLQAPTYNVDGKQYADVGSAVTALDNTGVKYDVDPASGARTNGITLQGGDPNQPVLIKNVATGQAPNDAANTGQVNAAKAQAMAYTDSRVATFEGQLGGVDNQLASLQSQVDQNRREARQGAAIGLAAASLHYDDRPGKLSTSIGGGLWKGEYATAMGLGYSLPSGWARLSANGVTTGRDFGVGAGASFTLN